MTTDDIRELTNKINTTVDMTIGQLLKIKAGYNSIIKDLVKEVEELNKEKTAEE